MLLHDIGMFAATMVCCRARAVQALVAADKVFRSETNGKGFKVINGCGVIQGDGISITKVAEICDAVLEAGFSAENVAFGMGGGLLQKVNRDTMGFATKLCQIHYAETDAPRDVMKCPKTDASKFSLPGPLVVKRVDGIPTVFPAESVDGEGDLLEVVYDCGPVTVDWPSFDELRQRVASEWRSLPPAHNPLSAEMQQKVKEESAKMQATADDV